MNRVIDLAQNVAAVEQKIAAACERAGRSRQEVTLVAVSKKMPIDLIVQALEAGITDLGENRIEEAAAKIENLPALTALPHRWHMVGHVQSRKAREIVQAGFSLVHSLDDLKLAQRYNQFAMEQQVQLPVLLQVNVSGEASKSGWQLYDWQNQRSRRETFWEAVATLLSLPGLQLAGLMTMAPIVEEAEATRPVFSAMAALREALQAAFPQAGWPHLSMGMTDDFEVAIEEGATIIRVGRALFGERPPL